MSLIFDQILQKNVTFHFQTCLEGFHSKNKLLVDRKQQVRDREPPGQRPSPRQRPPWTETLPPDRDPPRTNTPLWTEPSPGWKPRGQRPCLERGHPGQTPPPPRQTPPDRDPLPGQRFPLLAFIDKYGVLISQ